MLHLPLDYFIIRFTSRFTCVFCDISAF